MTNPAVLHAQTSGDAGPVVGKVAPGQTAATTEGTLEQALNYGANAIFPLLMVAFFGWMIFAIRTGRGWLVSAVCGVLCILLSSLCRLAEHFVQAGAGGIQ
jgi:hypothetical protein